jgi:glycosyltransferase involved in cell wall biosynthesis
MITKTRERLALKNADGLLSVSQYTANVTKELFSLNKDFTIIPNGIDLNHFNADLSGTTDQNTILYFGTLIRKKGLLELPLIFNQVYKENQQAKLILIGRDTSDILTGNPSVWSMMQPLFNQKAFQNVSYLGSVSYEDMKEHISRASVCVFPTFAEALPVSWIESMAVQKAVVASNIGWASEIITDGQDGFLVHPHDHQVFAQKIVTLLSNEKLRNQFGEAARKKVEQKFSLQVVAAQSVDYYKQLLPRKA